MWHTKINDIKMDKKFAADESFDGNDVMKKPQFPHFVK
jgi:hypothetical protein